MPTETRLALEVRPRAGRDEIVGWQGDRLRLRVRAAPADCAANEAVRALLAERLRCARTRIEIVQGHGARTKIVRVVGLAPGEAARRLEIPGGAPPALTAARSR
jgi:uncharacterized protein YggU (UPF0235/DUF167 family)